MQYICSICNLQHSEVTSVTSQTKLACYCNIFCCLQPFNADRVMCFLWFFWLHLIPPHPTPMFERLYLVSNTHLIEINTLWNPHMIKKMLSYRARGRPNQNCIPATSRAVRVSRRDSGPVSEKFSFLSWSGAAELLRVSLRWGDRLNQRAEKNKQQEPTGCKTQKPNKSIRLVGREAVHQ